MHNLHWMLVRAENNLEAQDVAENEAEVWGTENNWFNVLGSKNLKTNVISLCSRSSCWEDKDELLDKKYIVETIQANIDERSKNTMTHDEFCTKMQDLRDIMAVGANNSYEKDMLMNLRFDLQMELQRIGRHSETYIFGESYYDYDFGEVGMTICDSNPTHIVCIDMHN